MNSRIEELLSKAEREHRLSAEELVVLLTEPDAAAPLYAAADRVREKYVGPQVELRGLIEFSNICKQNCLYCGLRRDNQQVPRYRLEAQMILDFGRRAVELGYKTLVLQSGEDEFFAPERLGPVLAELKKLGVALTLSIGEKTREEYAALRAAGADRYLLRIETTDKGLYEQMDPGMSWDNRVRCLRDLKELGFEVGTGSLVGLPGQSVESLARDILFFQELDVDMVGIGPFIPNPDTPLANAAGGTFDLACRMMALTRLLLPDANIPATTAMETLQPDGRMLALKRGANVVMPNVTDTDYRKMYMLYPGKICLNDAPADCRGCVTAKIEGIGRTISQDQGFRRKRNPAG
ncbi:MAG: [FeFe] hydrogenase maturase subunit HydE [Firmicutes bacterium]|nr:[FeFe] hydrogenase maturase subunit HydE [Bacillota bacterium]